MKSIVLAFFFAGLSLASLANGPVTGKTESTAEVKYVGNSSGEYFFNVQYDNAAGSRFVVAILDESGSQLYSGVYSAKKFDKNFRLVDTESFGKLVFVIRNLGDNSVQRFEVSTDSREIEDVEVKEVK